MTVFETRDYKKFLKSWLAGQPNEGRGLLVKIAQHASMSPAMMTHVLNGEKHFSPEAANDIASFLGLGEEETEYFLLLVNHERAGTHALRERLKKKIASEQKRMSEIGKKLNPDKALPEAVKAVFYSHWIYSAIRHLSACADFPDVDSIAKHLQIARPTVQKAVDFLVQHDLCVIKKGRLAPGPQITHIGNQTSLVGKHHQNWRLHGFTKMLEQSERNLFVTMPMSMSREAAEMIRFKLPAFIEEIRNIVAPSESEVVRCFNLDWYEY